MLTATMLMALCGAAGGDVAAQSLAAPTALPGPAAGAETAPAAPLALPPLPAASPVPAQLRLRVVADSDDVALYLARGLMPKRPADVSATALAGTAICRGSCDVTLEMPLYDDYFYFDGDGMPRSSAFRLLEYGTDVTVRASAGSLAQRFSGVALVVLGIVSGLTISAFAALFGALDRAVGRGGGDYQVAFWSALVGGLALVTVGGVLAGTSGTTYRVEPRR